MTRGERIAAFPVGCRVELSELGVRAGVSSRAPAGVVEGHSHRYDALIIRRDGRKAVVVTHVAFWRRSDEQPQIEEHW